MPFTSLRAHIFFLVAIFGLAVQNSADGQIVYSSSNFTNRVVVSSTATQYSITADILESGVLAGTLNGSLTYGGGTNPFTAPNWVAGGNLNILGSSTNTSETSETADGVWDFSITPAAGFQVDGISLFTNGTVIGNPTFANLTSNGTGSVIDANEGTSTELFSNYNSGAFVNGDDLVFNAGGLSTGIDLPDHSLRWSYDSAGATQLSFDYQAGPVANISNEGIRLDVQLSAIAVPEPSGFALLGLLGSLAVLRRRKSAA